MCGYDKFLIYDQINNLVKKAKRLDVSVKYDKDKQRWCLSSEKQQLGYCTDAVQLKSFLDGVAAAKKLQ